jgi:RNA polymerase sigma-70 factor (ECF subfamily)
MSEPEALSRPDAIGVGGTRLAMESLEAFVSEHYSRLVRLAGLVTRDVDQAQDAVQAALERAWRKREQANADSVRPWLDRIVVREAIRQAQGRNRLAPWRHDPTDWIDMPANTPEPAELAVLREALGRLSPDHRAVIALHLYAGYSVDETARILQVPFDTVRSRLRAARERLRRELGEASA